METTLFFVRHARPDVNVRDEATRPLTPEGAEAAERVADFFAGAGITAVWSSPYLRAVDTVRPFALRQGLPVRTDADFRERKVENGWIDDFRAFSRNQWSDFRFRLDGGECLDEVRTRNLAAMGRVLAAHPGGRVLIGSHGTALSTLVHHFLPSFGYDAFWTIIDRIPWIVRFRFEADRLVELAEVRLPETRGVVLPEEWHASSRKA